MQSNQHSGFTEWSESNIIRSRLIDSRVCTFLTLYLPFFVAVVEDLLTLEKEKLRYRILRKKDSPEESRANGAP